MGIIYLLTEFHAFCGVTALTEGQVDGVLSFPFIILFTPLVIAMEIMGMIDQYLKLKRMLKGKPNDTS